ncbi:MAG: ferrous iron transport protein A [Candidatus Bathyarchaeota archaeon]|nr:FeoA family protein [Candidatus Bathyarchaeum tardum]WGM88618.1 MAG: FeoA family protein [Candidatus Bathyarchaeum tardum]WNZ29126.1 MAG: ferrous iron transport protein A [Candidatus Bathyarchaeota archaeon]
MQIPLTELKNGEKGIIVSTVFKSPDAPMCQHRARKGWKKKASIELCIKRLTDLGLTPGTEVTVVKSAPFKGPLEIYVRGSRLAIGRGMASRILMEVKR